MHKLGNRTQNGFRTGSTHTEESKQKQRESARLKWERSGGTPDETKRKLSESGIRFRIWQISRYSGLSVEEVKRKSENGERWCAMCLSFKPSAEFADSHRRCRVCGNKRNTESAKKYRDVRVAARREAYAGNKNGEREEVRRGNLLKYKATPEWYRQTLQEQGGGCAICGCSDNGKVASFAIDHDHACCAEKKKSCGKCRRGLLCSRCNQGLGMVEVSDWLERALAYLAKYK